MEELIGKHLDKYDLDIRKKPDGFSRYMDQKVTPDVLAFIADCVVNFLGGKPPDTCFTVKDIWNSPYFAKNIVVFFGKPSPENQTADAEYNKFIGQPLKTLAFAKIISEKKVGRENTYTVSNPELLDQVSQNENNAWLFLVRYIEKVMTDSGFIKELVAYREKALAKTLTEKDFESLRENFEAFTRGYTNINERLEIRRIFPKILNPYAAYYELPGTEGGRMTTGRFIYPDLMYNRENFRDIGKDKTLTRQEAEKMIAQEPELVAYKVQKAKNVIKRHHSSSELKDTLAAGLATQVHHIFPEHEFPQISAYLENLILLTPQQHNTRAHPNNKTNTIDPSYQKECLLAKLDSIESSLRQSKDVYSKEAFIHVLNVGLAQQLPSTLNVDELRKKIREIYG